MEYEPIKKAALERVLLAGILFLGLFFDKYYPSTLIKKPRHTLKRLLNIAQPEQHLRTNYLLLFNLMQLRPNCFPTFWENIFSVYHALRQSLKFSSQKYQLVWRYTVVLPLANSRNTDPTQLCNLSCAP